MNIDLKKVDNIVFDGINHSDHPDYSDSYIVSADYNGEPMTDEQIEWLNDQDEWKLEKLMNKIF